MSAPRVPTAAEVADAIDAGAIDGLVDVVSIGGPAEAPDVVPCPTVVCPDGSLAVLWDLDDEDRAKISLGGPLWLVCYGGLPIHRIEVVRRST
jgi:hypothetical protein